jgi:hypothetical protein
MILDQNDNLPATLSEQAEEAIYQMAEAMGILVTEEEAAILEKFSEATAGLNEQQNIVKLNRQSKLNSLTSRAALVIAQQKKDVLFAKYARAAKLKRDIRAVIYKKYGTQAASTARKLLANAGKRNMVDISQRPSSFSAPGTRP